MTPPRQPCFIHIGAPKTGTTFIQKFLFENRDRLLGKGVLYPDVSLRGYGHHDLAFLLAGGYPEWATSQPRSLTELQAELREKATGHDGALLLSSENFYLYPEPEKLMETLALTGITGSHRPVIIMYVRRQDKAHESWYNQTIKAQGYTHTPDECIESFMDLWDYRKQSESWASVFGPENIVLRPYETGQFINGSLIDDFLHQIHLGPADWSKPAASPVNASINRDILEFQQSINHLPLSPLEKRSFLHELSELSMLASGTGLFDEGPLLDFRQRTRIKATYEAGNTWVARKYLGRDELFFEDMPPGDELPSDREGLSSRKLLYILGWLMIRKNHK